MTPAHPAPTHINLTSETENDPIGTYPSITKLLTELDKSMPALRFLQYEEVLLAAGFGYVHQVRDTPAVCSTLKSLGVPISIMEEIIEPMSRMTRRASKLKSTIKSEDDIHGS
jgi:hypothetical protein